MDNQYKISGLAFTLYGALSTIVFLAIYIFGGITLSDTSKLPLLVLLMINIMLAVNFLCFLCGIYLLKQNKTVHSIAMPLSVILLLSIPFGTIVGSLYLIERFRKV
ncbi:hypothetical protein [Thalassotalea marina]|uniref:hypothetical protein n=1 Tax=Thalassotalea marina TaxID=1673741 RepID=UPI0016788DFF|nr:hypothetical protein [Thalassotalea marina]